MGSNSLEWWERKGVVDPGSSAIEKKVDNQRILFGFSLGREEKCPLL